jgi:phosphoribosyl-ATP pyrophosphohydrolase/phosphoribosyl-AMP cyclohydrolase
VRIEEPGQLAALDFEKAGGLVPVVAQHARTGEVLMLAFADRTALERTLRDGTLWLFSRSRAAHWLKGETSGNTQRLVSLHADCDRDTVLALVEPAGPACHTGAWSCFDAPPVLPSLATVIADRIATGDHASYTRRLLDDENLRLKKLGEEAVELALACAARDRRMAAREAADLIYHTLVACAAVGATLDDVLAVLADRRR